MSLLLASLALVFSFSGWASDLPDPVLTHGAINLNVTQENIQQTVCVKGYTKTIAPRLPHQQPQKAAVARVWLCLTNGESQVVIDGEKDTRATSDALTDIPLKLEVFDDHVAGCRDQRMSGNFTSCPDLC